MDFVETMKNSWHWLVLVVVLLGVIYALGSGPSVPVNAPEPVRNTGQQFAQDVYEVYTMQVTLTNDSIYNNVTIPLVIGSIKQMFVNATGTNVSSFLIVNKNNVVWYSQTGVTAALVINGTYLNQSALMPFYYGPLTLAFRNGTKAGNATKLTVEIITAIAI
jgi:hypothetical protein